MKFILIVLYFLINFNLAATDSSNNFKFTFYNYADLETFIDESINLPGDVYFNSSELIPFYPQIKPYVVFIFANNISQINIDRLIHQFITVDIKQIERQ